MTADGAAAAAAAAASAAAPVRVAVHVRPLLSHELLEGAAPCLEITPGAPQITVGQHSFTFDHLYGEGGPSSDSIFSECVAPLVDGLFGGYNATVLAYGQTGSGKTYTMGTAYAEGAIGPSGITPLAMARIMERITQLQDTEVLVRVSFIEIHKEEIRDLLTPMSERVRGRPEQPVVLRELPSGGVCLAGAREVEVCTLNDMQELLRTGTLSRATAATGMNAHSSRSHAIFTITLEQRRHATASHPSENGIDDNNFEVDALDGDDYLCAKLHLVDLAGSERAKRTGTVGDQFQEGVKINAGLLALGNVISALGDPQRKVTHVPYRDSKLTRLLQDSLGGNSRTVMIACVSPADKNYAESLNTLRYANRARNIQNTPTVNRMDTGAEVARLRAQIKVLQMELQRAREANGFTMRSDISFEDYEVMQRKNVALEADVAYLKLHLARVSPSMDGEQQLPSERWSVSRGVVDEASEDHEDAAMLSSSSGGGSGQEDEKQLAEEEQEYEAGQERLGTDLKQLTNTLRAKEEQMARLIASDARVAAVQSQYEAKLAQYQHHCALLQAERETLVQRIHALAAEKGGANNKKANNNRDNDAALRARLAQLEAQLADLQRKQAGYARLVQLNVKREAASKQLQNEIFSLKQQRVTMMKKMRADSEAFAAARAAQSREILQLRRAGQKDQYELHKIQALYHKQQQVIKRKHEEADAAKKRLKEELTRRQYGDQQQQQQQQQHQQHQSGSVALARSNSLSMPKGEAHMREWVRRELELAVRMHAVQRALATHLKQRTQASQQLEALASVRESSEGREEDESETAALKEAAALHTVSIRELQAELSSAESVRQSSWQFVNNLADARALLRITFDSAVDARCKLQAKEQLCTELREEAVQAVAALDDARADSQRLLEQQQRQQQQQQQQQQSHSSRMASPPGTPPTQPHSPTLVRIRQGPQLPRPNNNNNDSVLSSLEAASIKLRASSGDAAEAVGVVTMPSPARQLSISELDIDGLISAQDDQLAALESPAIDVPPRSTPSWGSGAVTAQQLQAHLPPNLAHAAAMLDQHLPRLGLCFMPAGASPAPSPAQQQQRTPQQQQCHTPTRRLVVVSEGLATATPGRLRYAASSGTSSASSEVCDTTSGVDEEEEEENEGENDTDWEWTPMKGQLAHARGGSSKQQQHGKRAREGGATTSSLTTIELGAATKPHDEDLCCQCKGQCVRGCACRVARTQCGSGCACNVSRCRNREDTAIALPLSTSLTAMSIDSNSDLRVSTSSQASDRYHTVAFGAAVTKLAKRQLASPHSKPARPRLHQGLGIPRRSVSVRRRREKRSDQQKANVTTASTKVS